MRHLVCSLVLLPIACALPAGFRESFECPCPEGWYCQEAENVCVRGARPDAAIDASTDAGRDAEQDAPADRDVGTEDAGRDTGGSCPPLRPWECLLDDVVGFGEGVTGGAGAPLCWVDSLESSGPGTLRACLTRPSPTWVVFRVSGTIDLSTSLHPSSNTTIDGRGQRIVLESPSGPSDIFEITDSNIVISHLFLQNSARAVRALPGASDLWLNHLSVTDLSINRPIDSVAARVTISWCHVHDTGRAMVLGGSPQPELTATMHHNLLADIFEGIPDSAGRVHSFNNYIRGYRLSGARVAWEGELLSERNVYEAGPDASAAAITSRAGGTITVRGNFRSIDDVFLAGAYPSSDNDPSAVFTPAYEYTAELPDAALRTRLEAEAGWQATSLPLP